MIRDQVFGNISYSPVVTSDRLGWSKNSSNSLNYVNGHFVDSLSSAITIVFFRLYSRCNPWHGITRHCDMSGLCYKPDVSCIVWCWWSCPVAREKAMGLGDDQLNFIYPLICSFRQFAITQSTVYLRLLCEWVIALEFSPMERVTWEINVDNF